MKKLWILAIPIFLASSMVSSADASWLGKQLKKLEKATATTSSTTSNGEMTLPYQSNRWVEVYENKYYTLYGDTRSLKASGTAQHRTVEGFFKRVYTPVGSQRLGETSGGRVKPDVITHSIYYTRYGTTSKSYDSDPKYYDVHGNLIYEGYLDDLHGWGSSYTPDSEDEQIKDILFHAFGWDY